MSRLIFYKYSYKVFKFPSYCNSFLHSYIYSVIRLDMKRIVLFILIISIALCIIPFAGCHEDAPAPSTTYSIWLDIGEDKISCNQNVYFVNTSEYILDKLVFNVYANAYDDTKPLPCTQQEQNSAYPNGISFGDFNLINVYGDFKSYSFDFINNLIVVELNDKLLPTQSISIDFVYDLIPPNTNLRYGYNDKALSLTGFYPQLCALIDGEWFYRNYSPIGDPYFSDTANYEAHFNLPDECEYICSGQNYTTQLNGETFVTTNAKNIRDFAIVISPVLTKTQTLYNDIQISYLGESTQVIDYAKKAIDTYSELYGEYPYDTLSLASVPFVAGGMEYGSLCVISDTLMDSDIELVTAHEIAHQWWYSAVGSNNLTDAWQDEGLTEYSTYLYFMNTDRQGYAKAMLENAYYQYEQFAQIQQSVGEPIKGQLAGELSSFLSNYHYTNLTYNKAFIMWHYLEQAIGKTQLQKTLALYYRNNLYQIASVEDLYTSLNTYIPNTSDLMIAWIENC